MSPIKVKQDPHPLLHLLLDKEFWMDLLTNLLIWAVLPLTTTGLAWFIYQSLCKRQARLETTRMTQSLAASHAIFTACEHIPDGLINRDLRRGLVLVLTHHLEVLGETNPLHPHLQEMQGRVTLLNRMPSGLQRAPLRSKLARRHASLALEELAKLLKVALKQHILDQKTGALAHASAVFTSQQVAVDTARQAAKDAENIRSYAKALSFAHQARSLCTKLPPLVGKSLTDAVSQDIERLESLAGHPARI
jgi:hypothetical protein